jgi:hypothetical protein
MTEPTLPARDQDFGDSPVAQGKPRARSGTFAHLYHSSHVFVARKVRIRQLPWVILAVDLTVGSANAGRFNLQDYFPRASNRAIDYLMRKLVASVDYDGSHLFIHAVTSWSRQRTTKFS